MQYLPDGRVTFNDIFEMNYDLFMEMGLGLDADKHLYDQDTMNPIMFKDKYIKAAIDPSPIYAGRNDILFDPANNYTLMNRLFGLYLDKAQNTDDGDILGGYIAHYVDDNEERDKQCVGVKTHGRGVISSEYYYNVYLAYIDCIFRIAGYIPVLTQFDIKPDKPKR